MRVLAVDDADELTDLIQVVLEDFGWLVDTACDASEGLLLARQGYDLILLDKNLPDMTEEEALARFLALTKDSTTAIIQMTGSRNTEPGPGVVGLLEKPFDPLSLGHRLLGIMEPS